MNTLSDVSPMPFGKHMGLPMQDVPVNYLHWFWCNGGCHDMTGNVADYIRRNLDGLKMENKDLIWD